MSAWQKFFAENGHKGACGTSVPTEEVYRHFRARLIEELAGALWRYKENGAEDLSRILYEWLERLEHNPNGRED